MRSHMLRAKRTLLYPSYVDGATGTTSATLPTHAVGDLIVAWAYRDGSTTAPSLGSGFTSILTEASNTTTNSGRLAYRIATVTDTASGTWTNATSVVFLIYRNAAVGVSNSASGDAEEYTSFSTLGGMVSDGSSWVAGFAGVSTTTSTVETPPSGMALRKSVVDATDEAAGYDTNAGVASWGFQNGSLGVASNWVSVVLEIKRA